MTDRPSVLLAPPPLGIVEPGLDEEGMGDGPYIPPHEDIAAWCGVALQTVRQWASGIRPAPAWAIELIARRDRKVSRGDVVDLWGSRYIEKHPEKAQNEGTR